MGQYDNNDMMTITFKIMTMMMMMIMMMMMWTTTMMMTHAGKHPGT